MEAKLCTVLLLFLATCSAAKDICNKNCSTTTLGRQKQQLNTILCSMQIDPCSYFKLSGSAPVSKVTNLNVKYYTVTHPDGQVGITLNISWQGQQNRNFENLIGFKVAVTKKASAFGNAQSKWNYVSNLCLHHRLDFNKHIFATFADKCVGVQPQQEINPGDKLEVRVHSWPEENIYSKRTFLVAGCEEKAFYNHTFCIVQRQCNASLEISGCGSERVWHLSYSSPSEYGNNITILLCLKNWKSTQDCHSVKNATLPIFGKETLTWPKELSSRQELEIIIKCQNGYEYQTGYRLQAKKCQAANYTEGVVIVIACIAVFGLLILVAYLRCNRRKKKKDENENHQIEEVIVNRHPCPGEKLFLVCLEDSVLYVNAIRHLIEYLQNDLRFSVISHLNTKEVKEISESVSSWTDRSMKAENVLIIWSSCAQNLWEKHVNNETEKTQLFFMDHTKRIFSRVIQQVVQDAFRRKRVYFATFQCFKSVSFPFLSYYQRFCIETEFQELFFDIVKIQRYTPTTVHVLEDPSNTEYGQAYLNALTCLNEQKRPKQLDGTEPCQSEVLHNEQESLLPQHNPNGSIENKCHASPVLNCHLREHERLVCNPKESLSGIESSQQKTCTLDTETSCATSLQQPSCNSSNLYTSRSCSLQEVNHIHDNEPCLHLKCHNYPTVMSYTNLPKNSSMEKIKHKSANSGLEIQTTIAAVKVSYDVTKTETETDDSQSTETKSAKLKSKPVKSYTDYDVIEEPVITKDPQQLILNKLNQFHDIETSQSFTSNVDFIINEINTLNMIDL